ncbi:4-(cytidine 5'-diphospho)-2-C-methyl-D-erythritol kinase [Marinimicrococcus flavescens]|uniref:4-diphosphocytidyl-2-C-methyl-D-erythritol kinase n=1 Tax=Marinimicrococcus flavescens TaxID=3031815 RepID=A0AAP3UZ76_9PROT|nr:4-(cytidine 5'-diphospho)-2-C-methyl-D-erythritol kinase [Marinimicrococcus flavescens]
MAEPLCERAPAKINLDLLVTARRPDGYHELDSLVVFAEAGDALRLEEGPGLRLVVEGPFAADVPAGGDNLVLRAARTLERHLGRDLPASAILSKRLPAASGIGGGSSDAAAMLRGLARLHRLDVPASGLAALALELGADVPVCLAARPMRMRGIGERLEPLSGLPDLPLVLANPRRPVPTKAVFARMGAPGRGRPRPALPAGATLPDLAAWLAASVNDLEAPALAIEPAIGEVLVALRRLEGCLLARMSGSGATCFGLFSDKNAAEAAARALAAARPDWWSIATTARGCP